MIPVVFIIVRSIAVPWCLALFDYMIARNNLSPTSLSRWVYVIAVVYFALHLATSTRYGYFRDALYYLACSEHLAFGYVDQPPLIAFLGWIARHTLGTSLPALIFWPALAGAIRLILTAAFARELGVGHFGTVLAAALAATPGVWWVIDHQFAMNCLEPLLWGGLAYVVLRLINTRNPRLWLAFGAIAGVGLMGCRRRSAGTKTIFSGGLATTPAKS